MKRNGYLFIILFLYTTPILGIGKDNPDSLQAVRECLSPLFAFGEKSYANPALQPYARQFSLSSLRLSGEYKNEKEAVIVQQGSGYRQGVFRAESYLHEPLSGGMPDTGPEKSNRFAGTKLPISNCCTHTLWPTQPEAT